MEHMEHMERAGNTSIPLSERPYNPSLSKATLLLLTYVRFVSLALFRQLRAALFAVRQ